MFLNYTDISYGNLKKNINILLDSKQMKFSETSNKHYFLLYFKTKLEFSANEV